MTPSGGKGVRCLAGRDDLSLLAWSDLGPDPAVHVYQYAAPNEIKNMPGRMINDKMIIISRISKHIVFTVWCSCVFVCIHKCYV